MKKIWDFLKDEDGIEMAEYAVMGALIILVAAGAAGLLGGAIDTTIGEVTTAVEGTAPAQ